MASFLRLYRKCLAIGSGNPVHHRLLTVGLKNLFNPLSWFAAGEQGAWYDPSDLTTLFQDAAGTIPVTAVEQPVGLMLDKSKGLALGAELVTNGDFSNGTTGWQGQGASTIALDNGKALVTTSGVAYNGISNVGNPITCVVGKTYVITAFAISGTYTNRITLGVGGIGWGSSITNSSGNLIYYFTATGTSHYVQIVPYNSTQIGTYWVDNISVKQIAGNHAFQATSGNRPVLSARVNLLLATATLSTQSVTSLATIYTLSFTGAGTVTLSGTATGTLSAGTNIFTATAGTLTLTVSGSVTFADLRPKNSGALLPPYQRVNTASDYNTVGFPLYLKTNGTSSAMSTNSIDFTSTDKMTVVTGVRKLSDAVFSVFMELSVNLNVNNSSFYIGNRASSLVNAYGFASKGTTIVFIQDDNLKIAPIASVITGQSSISTPYSNIRVDSILKNTSTSTQGTGNFGNYPLYLFARAGTSDFLNGQFYGAIIRGAQSDTASVTQAENYMATKTGITF